MTSVSLVSKLMRLPRITPRTLFLVALLFATYTFSAYLGQAFHLVAEPASFFPNAGIALAALVLGGFELWPVIALAAFIYAILVAHSTLALSLVFGGASALQALVGASLLERLRFDRMLRSLWDAFVLILVSLASGLVVPLLGSLARYLSGSYTPLELRTSFGEWWIGEIISILIIAPFLIRWLPRITFRRPNVIWVEIGSALTLLTVVTAVAFWTPYSEIDGVSLLYVLVIPFVWIALRLGPRVMTLALVLSASIAVAGATYTAGSSILVGTRVFSTELFYSMFAGVFLLLVTLAEERRLAMATLGTQVIELEKALVQIHNQDEAKTNFIATLAHELRNPLAPVLSTLELLHLRGTPSDIDESLDTIRLRVGTMSRLLDDLLDVTRISQRKLLLKRETIDLVQVAHTSLSGTLPVIAEYLHKVREHFPEEPIVIDADPVRIEQIIVNLLMNAAKYTNPGGTITLTVARDATHAKVIVSDTGVGIQPEMREKIFWPFHQGTPAKRMGGTGLGIGLALTKDLVDMHAGSIDVESPGLGRGSTFTVRLPLSAATLPKEIETPEAVAHKRLKIFIVDDNAVAAHSLSELLTHVGHETHLAHTGAEALSEASRIAADVIILDIGLPDMDGYAVARELIARGTTATIVALTGYGQDEDKQHAKEAGFAYHLVKPVSLAVLRSVLEEISAKMK